jgi:hypothetical protein
VGGTLFCYDLKTGQTKWTYSATDPYVEYKVSPYWWLYIVFASEGKLYVGHYEHSSGDPKPRGAPFLCFNATTGEIIWKIDGAFRQTQWGGAGIISDSIIATMDTYDQRVYAIGKGPSAVTVEAPIAGVPLGSSLVIRGMVTDISPGTKDAGLAMRFPNGVPAVADECMSDWMMYVYKQFQRPSDAIGVPVSIDVLDANGNFRNIGTVSSDAKGIFSLEWEPDIPGKYVVYATFGGSKSYYGSFDETSFVVDEVVVEPAPEYPQPVDSTMTIVYAAVGLGVLIAVGFAVLWLLLRKR